MRGGDHAGSQAIALRPVLPRLYEPGSVTALISIMAFILYLCWAATHLEKRDIRKKAGKDVFDEKVREIHEKTHKDREKSAKNKIVLANIFKNVYMAHFILIFCQRMRIISVHFSYTADNKSQGKTF